MHCFAVWEPGPTSNLRCARNADQMIEITETTYAKPQICFVVKFLFELHVKVPTWLSLPLPVQTSTKHFPIQSHKKIVFFTHWTGNSHGSPFRVYRLFMVPSWPFNSINGRKPEKSAKKRNRCLMQSFYLRFFVFCDKDAVKSEILIRYFWNQFFKFFDEIMESKDLDGYYCLSMFLVIYWNQQPWIEICLSTFVDILKSEDLMSSWFIHSCYLLIVWKSNNFP